MKNPISILSVGVSSPGGATPQVLSDTSSWPFRPVEEVIPGRGVRDVSTIDLSAEPVNRWRLRPRLRRASPLSHHLIEAVAQTLEARPEIDPARVGIVGAFFLGCLIYSVKFYKGLTRDGRRFASPVLFPETVANTPLSHVVAELGIGGPVYSQVGDTSGWISAIRTASVWLQNGDVDHVIVAGAEEFDVHELDGFHSVRWFDDAFPFLLAEGAGAILLGRENKNSIARITSIADGYSFRTRSQGRQAASDCMATFAPHLPVADTATSWITPFAAEATADRPSISIHCGPKVEAFTASCAWNTISAARLIENQTLSSIVVPAWGLSQQIGALALA